MTVFTINPYRSGDHWVFDEPELGLKGEAFVGGASVALDEVLKDLGLFDAALQQGFVLEARAGDSQGVIRDEGEKYDPYWSLCDIVLSRVDNPALQHPNNVLCGLPGTWYATHPHSVRQLEEPHVVWLCPALELFFGGKPKRIYIHARMRGVAELISNVEEFSYRAPMVPTGNFVNTEDANAIAGK